MADADRVYREAAAFVRDLGLDDHAERYVMSRPVEVIDAVVRRAHGWRNARNPSNAVTSLLRRHYVVMSGDYPRDVRSS
eukprot:6781819-Alexandrium_andersonii.AAC.1